MLCPICKQRISFIKNFHFNYFRCVNCKIKLSLNKSEIKRHTRVGMIAALLSLFNIFLPNYEFRIFKLLILMLMGIFAVWGIIELLVYFNSAKLETRK